MIDPLSRPSPVPMKFGPGDTVILCEGRDECAVLRELCEKKEWKRPPKIGFCQERENAGEEIKNLVIQVRKHGVATIGLVFDAEDRAAAATNQVKKWLKKAGLNPPDGPLQLARTVLNEVKVQTAFLINPHGKDSGTLESYFLPQVEKTSRWACIKELIACYREHEPMGARVEKVIVRTFIAHQNASNTGLSVAFRDKILNCTDKRLEPVQRFLDLLRKASPVEQQQSRARKTKGPR